MELVKFFTSVNRNLFYETPGRREDANGGPPCNPKKENYSDFLVLDEKPRQ